VSKPPLSDGSPTNGAKPGAQLDQSERKSVTGGDAAQAELEKGVRGERAPDPIRKFSAQPASQRQAKEEAGNRHADRERRAAEHELELLEPDDLVNEGGRTRREKHHIDRSHRIS
jgi:hypothetical protein